MTPTLTTIHFESAYLLCHVNTMCIQFDSLWMHIGSELQRASCKRTLRQPVHAKHVSLQVIKINETGFL